MIVLTSDVIPENLKVLGLLGTVSFTYRKKVEDLSTMEMVEDRKKTNGLDHLKAQASKVPHANCVFGVRISSTTATTPMGTFIYYVYHASVAHVRMV